MKFNFLYIFIFFGLAIAGCNVINPAEPVPTYVRIDSFNFKINSPSKEGSASQKISGVWIYFDNQAVGVYSLPAVIPVIADKKGVIQVIPAVVTAGLTDFQSQYPFFLADTFTIAPNPGKTIAHTPTTSYVPSAIFQWKEDFETGNTFLPLYPNAADDTSVVRTTDKDKVFEGGGSGYIYVDAAHPYSENVCNKGFPIGKGQSKLEINYKCSTSFQVGLFTTVSGSPVYTYEAGVKANEKWNKLYIDLSTFVGNNPGTEFNVMIKTGLEEGATTGYVLMDNIKVISY